MNDSSKKFGERGKHPPDGEVGSETPDAALLADVAAGRADAFWCLWNRHQRGLHRLCLREMDGHVADAEDALSQVMLKAQDRLRASAGKILHLEAWLHRLARNLCIDLRRERQRHSETLESWGNETGTEPKFDQSMLHLAAESEIQLQIAALPPALREPFVLHVVREIPVKEVASQLGLTPANVRKRVQLARASLRRDITNSRDGNGNPQTSERHPPGATPARLPQRQSNKPLELFPSAAFIRTVRVKLPCGVEQLFHVFPLKAPFGLERKMKSLRSYVLKNPDNWEKHLELADLFHLTGDWNKAVAEWRQVLPCQSSLPPVLKLGDTLLKLGGIEMATGIFKNARAQSFHSPATVQHLDGWIALCQRNGGNAVMKFQAAAELEPENPVHWHTLALAHRLAGATLEALAAIQRALKLNPDDLAALSLGHEMLLAAGDVGEASRRAQHLLKLAPFDLLTLRRLIDCRCQLRLTQGTAGLETVRLLRLTQRLSQNSFLMHETLASFFFAQGKPQKALAVHRKFSEAHPQCLHSRQIYSRLLAATGLSDRLPAELGVLKWPTTKRCHGLCQRHKQVGFLRV